MPLRPAAPATLALLMAAAPVAACPTALGAGLVYVTSDEARTTVTPTDRADVLAERTVLPDGTGLALEALFGVFPLRTVEFDAAGAEDPATLEVSVFAVPPAMPAPGTTTEGILASVDTPLGSFERVHAVTAGALAPARIGRCTFEAMPVALAITEADFTFVQRMLHVPALGMAFFLGIEDGAGAELYEIVSVEALAAGR